MKTWSIAASVASAARIAALVFAAFVALSPSGGVIAAEAKVDSAAAVAGTDGTREGAAAPAAGDPAASAEIYTRCEACHALAWDRTGPRHCGLIGRKAGSVPGFAYSDAMKRSGIVWNAATLDRFLADPLRAVPGTTMGYAGVVDARERADLIAFLREQSNGPKCARQDHSRSGR